ncbi:MAG: ATP-binding protein, partial [Geminicoccaceae bacterium]
DIVENYHGHVPARAGDGGLGYFGYPVAHEDATHLAVSAALEIVESDCSPASPIAAFQLRIGVATSLVVIGRSEGMDQDFVGIAPNLAARLQELAAPNTVSVADETYRLTRRAFRYQPMGRHDLKGFPDKQAVWRLLGRRQRTERFQAHRRPALPLVGRDKELRTLVRIWSEASGGRGRALFVTGDAGIGKSRLLTELRRKLRKEATDIRVFQCSPEDRATPLQPFRRLLEEALPSVSDQRLVAAGASEWDTVGSLSSQDFLKFLIGKAGAKTDLLERLPPDEIRHRAKVEIEELVKSWARARPQLLFFEDLHWCDSFSLEVIEHLIDSLGNARIMLAATSRTDVLRSKDTRSAVYNLELQALDESSTKDLVHILWRAQPVPERLPSLIFDKTDGMPLFVEELSSLLLDRRSRSSENNGYDFDAALSEFNVMSSKDLITARLADLGKARAVVQTASVLGRRCARESVIRLSDLPTGQIDQALETICRSGLMIQQEHAGADVFVFKHALVQDAAYASILKSKRRLLHGRALRILGSTGLVSEAVLARHAEGAGEIGRAIDLLIKAGRHASRRSALQEARQLLDHAKTLIRHDDVRSNATALELRIIQILGPVMIMLEGPGSEAAHSLYRHGVTLCET